MLSNQILRHLRTKNIKKIPFLANPICCLYTKLENIDMALKWLEIAIKLNYPNINWLKKDPDIKKLHDNQYDKFMTLITATEKL